MANFGSLWIGNPLTKVEQTCLSSFIYYGHDITLFVYDMSLEVPPGVLKKNANKIILESEIFKIENSYGPFADMFRYKMIQETGLTWTDTDSICLRSDWDFESYLFGFEKNHTLANGILRIPKDDLLVKLLVDTSSRYDKTKIMWSEIGPQLLTKLVNEMNLLEYAQPIHTFYPIGWRDYYKMWDPENTEEVLNFINNSHTLQMWNQCINRKNINKNELPKNSTIDYFYNKFKNYKNIF